jgi:hypothetical protein
MKNFFHMILDVLGPSSGGVDADSGSIPKTTIAP